MNSCSTYEQVETIRSTSYRTYIIFNDSLLIFTLILSFLAIKLLHHDRLFGSTARNLVFFTIAYYSTHGNWSLYRSFTAADVCDFGFVHDECRLLFIIGVFVRIMLGFVQLAITIDRLIVTIFPRSEFVNSGVTNVLFVRSDFHPFNNLCGFPTLIAIIITNAIKPSNDTPNVASLNCFQLNNEEIVETTRHLLYINMGGSLICLPINLLVLTSARHRFAISVTRYTLGSRFTTKSNLQSAMVISVMSFVQTCIHLVYIVLRFYDIHFSEISEMFFFQNTPWFYTLPYGALALPSSILIAFHKFNNISMKRNKIEVMTPKKLQDIYFKDLTESWSTPKRHN